MRELTEYEQAQADRLHRESAESERRAALHARAVARRRKAKRGGPR